jgi:hypothetical protein
MAMKMAVDSMETALGAISRPGRVPKQRSPPKLVFDGGAAAELYLGKRQLI